MYENLLKLIQQAETADRIGKIVSRFAQNVTELRAKRN